MRPQASKWQIRIETQGLSFLHTKVHAQHDNYLKFCLQAEAAESPLLQAEVLGCSVGLLSECPVCQLVLAVFLGSQWGLAGFPVY